MDFTCKTEDIKNIEGYDDIPLKYIYSNRVLNREPERKDDLLDDMKTWIDNADENSWYYIAVQEATNSHTYKMEADGKHEKWTALTEKPDWSKLEK